MKSAQKMAIALLFWSSPHGTEMPRITCVEPHRYVGLLQPHQLRKLG